MSQPIKLTMIGLDTSHSIRFAKVIQGKPKDGQTIDGLKVLHCMRYPSPFQSEPDQDKRQEELETMDINVTTSMEEAMEGIDGVLLEANDPAMHWDLFQQVVEYGKPIFLDKPLADTVENGKKIIALAKEKNIPFWSASSLRYSEEMEAAIKEIEKPILCNVHGPLGEAAVGSNLIWYGVHATEMMTRIMGLGAKTVSAHKDGRGVVQIVQYEGNRRGIIEVNDDQWVYGGRVQGDNKAINFEVNKNLYYNILLHIREFFQTGTIPVPLNETLEIQAIMNAAERSVNSGKEEAVWPQ